MFRKSRNASQRKVDYQQLSPWDLEVNETGLIENLKFRAVDCLESLKEAKFTVPDYAVKNPWSDMGAAFCKSHVTDTKLATFFKKGEGPKELDPPEKSFFDDVTRSIAATNKVKMQEAVAKTTGISKSESTSSADSIQQRCKKSTRMSALNACRT